MGVTGVIKSGFSLSGKLLKVVVLFFILNAIMGLMSLPLANPDNAANPGIAAASLGISVVFFAIFVFLQGGALGIVKDLLKTDSFQMSNFSVYGKKYYLRILGLLLLYIGIALVVVLVLGLIGSGILTLADNIATRAIVGAIAALCAIAAIVVLMFPIYSIVVNDIGTVDALKKGAKIGWSNFWKVLGLFLVLVLISIVISLAAGFIIGLVTIPLPFMVTQVLITIVNSAVQAYIPIVMMIALMKYYMGLDKAALEGPAA